MLLYKRCTEGQGFGELCAYESNGQGLQRPSPLNKESLHEDEKSKSERKNPIEFIASPLSTSRSTFTPECEETVLSNNIDLEENLKRILRSWLFQILKYKCGEVISIGCYTHNLLGLVPRGINENSCDYE